MSTECKELCRQNVDRMYGIMSTECRHFKLIMLAECRHNIMRMSTLFTPYCRQNLNYVGRTAAPKTFTSASSSCRSASCASVVRRSHSCAGQSWCATPCSRLLRCNLLSPSPRARAFSTSTPAKSARRPCRAPTSSGSNPYTRNTEKARLNYNIRSK